MYDLLIKNGLVYDGTGSLGTKADIAIKNGEILDIGELRNVKASKVIDAEGACVSPGFIDIQNHSDAYWALFDHPHMESMTAQGITTINVGNCGASLAPLPSLEGLKAIQKWHSLDGINANWMYFSEFLDEVDKQELGVNVASLIGHSTIRRGLVADEVRKVTESELKVLERLTVSSLKSGAFGLSMGLIYAHEYDSSQEELLELARIVSKFDRLLSFHLRSEGGHILESLDEVIRLAELSGARIKIAHLKVRGASNWENFDEVVNKIETAYQKGIKVCFDVYPYDTTWGVLYTYLPKWAAEGGLSELKKKLAQPYLRRKILNSLHEQTGADLSHLVIATATSSPHLVGRSIIDIARDQGTSVNEAILNILTAVKSEVMVFDKNISEDHVDRLMCHPLSIISTDGAGFDLDSGSKLSNLVHPRCFGAMPRFLSRVLQKKSLPLEKALHKITGYPAKALGLTDRGTLKIGKAADITVLRPEKLRDTTSLGNPFCQPEGITHVICNGVVVLEDGEMTGKYAGQILKA